MEQAIQEIADASAEHEVPSSGSEGGICLATKNTLSVPTSHSAGNVQKGMTRSSSENLLPRLEKTPRSEHTPGKQCRGVTIEEVRRLSTAGQQLGELIATDTADQQ